MNNQPLQTAAAASVFAGEREYHSISFLRSGDRCADFLLAVITAHETLGISSTEGAEICEYLSRRWRRTVADLDIHRQAQIDAQKQLKSYQTSGNWPPSFEYGTIESGSGISPSIPRPPTASCASGP